MGAPHAELSVRLWRRVNKTDSCWLWTGSTDTGGYGSICDEAGRTTTTHRVSWTLRYGPIPAGALVLHDCDKDYPPGDITYRRCVRPEHLWLGTKAENAADMVAKGRQATGDHSSARLWRILRPRGERHPKAKLTEELVRAIRSDYRAATSKPQIQPMSLRGLAKKYGVEKGTIRAVVTGATWRHVS